MTWRVRDVDIALAHFDLIPYHPRQMIGLLEARLELGLHKIRDVVDRDRCDVNRELSVRRTARPHAVKIAVVGEREDGLQVRSTAMSQAHLGHRTLHQDVVVVRLEAKQPSLDDPQRLARERVGVHVAVNVVGTIWSRRQHIDDRIGAAPGRSARTN